MPGRKGGAAPPKLPVPWPPMLSSLARTFVVAACSVLFVPALAGPLDKAFAALEVHDYFTARQIFQKQVKKHPAAAWYGLSVISGRANNPFFHVDSCYGFIMRSDAAFTAAPDKERAWVGKLGVDHAAIEAQKLHAFTLGWERAKGLNTIAGYDWYIGAYIASPFVADAVLVRDHLAFQMAREENTAAGYRNFLEHYPGAREVFEARTRFNDAEYREATASGDLEAFAEFVRTHPENPHVQQAEEELYRLSTPGRTVAEYHAFIKAYPRNRKVNDAWRAIYEQYTRDLSTNTITRFLQEFPDYPFVEELVEDYRTASLYLLPFRRDSLWGFIDDQGTERVKAQYEWVEPFEGAQAIVGLNGRAGTINRSGRVVVPIEYDEIADPAEGTCTVERGDHVGAVDRNGELVVPMTFEDVGEFSAGLAYAAREGLYGYIDPRGQVVIGLKYLSAGTFHNGIAVVETEQGTGAIDVRDNFIVPPQYDWVEGFANPLSRVRKGGKVGMIGPFGDVLVPLEYDHIGVYSDGVALVVQGGKCGYIGADGKLVVPLVHESFEGITSQGDFHGGLAKVRSKGKYGFINVRNERVLSIAFADVGLATGPLIPVRKKTKWGYADRKGAILFDNRYDMAWEMIDGLARVRSGEFIGMIDSTGKEVVPLRFTEVAFLGNAYLLVRDANGAGLLGRDGKEVLAPAYDAVQVVDDRIVRVERNDRFGYILLADGRFIWKEEGFDKP
jgi:WG containing repeat